MCGIVGYIGPQSAVDVLLQSLEILEYRGYDSAGIAVLSEDNLFFEKRKGKLINLKNAIDPKKAKGGLGIGHTRWATHGIPSDANSHPHQANQGYITLVHNGIINNYLQIKERLIKDHNIEFHSDTDTEVIANLLEINYLANGRDLKSALSQTIDEITGSYALCVIEKGVPDQLMLVSCEAPLVIGIGEGELYCASDSAALLPYTKRIIRLNDYEIAQLSLDGEYKIFQPKSNDLAEPEIQLLDADAQLMDKAGFKHYLIKEIHEQPNILRKLYSYHFADNSDVVFPDLDESKLKDVQKILIIGCGTAYYAGMIGKYVLESLANIPVEIEFSSEILARPNLLVDKDTLVIAMSQSGETADTLMAAKMALSAGARLIAINNRPESSLVQLAAKSSIFTQAGIEVSVAATKSFSAQIFCLYALAIKLAEMNKSQPESHIQWIKEQLHYQPNVIEQILTRKESFAELIQPYAAKNSFIFLGRGVNYPIALEGALKLKELTYVQATGYASGEMKHGPIATLDENVPTIAILLPGLTYEKTIHNMLEARTRGSQNIAILQDGDKEGMSQVDTPVWLPENINSPAPNEFMREIVNSFAAVIPLQLIAYYLAEYLGKDVDQPRNLAKSVTVQ